MKHVIVVIAVIAGAARSAAAQCNRLTHLSPASATVLPRNPTVFAFFRRGADAIVTATEDGKPLAVRAEIVDDNDAWTVVRAQIETLHAGTIHVLADPYEGAGEATYTISDDAPAGDARLFAAEPVEDDWSCSFTRGVQFDVTGNAVAYRLEWATDIDELRFGAPHRAYLWPRPSEAKAHDPRGRDELLAGHVSCHGWDLPEEAVAQGVFVRLVAIFADGREQGEDLGWMRITGRAIHPPDWYRAPIDLRPGGPATIELDDAPTIVEAPAPAMWPALAAAAGGGALSAAIVVLALGRPRRRTRRGLGEL